RSQSLLDYRDGFASSRRIIDNLITPDLADAEIFCLGMRKIKPAHTRAGMHRKRLRQFYSRILLRIEQIEQRSLLFVIGAGGITRRRPDPAIFFAAKLDLLQFFRPAKTPRDAGLFVQAFSEPTS